MQIDIRPVARLRGPGAVDVPAALASVFAGLAEAPVDLARLRVVCDWIQYRHNFTAPVSCRPVLADRHTARYDTLEIAIDLRRSGETDLATGIKQVLAAPLDRPGKVVLEPWRPARESCIWQFNTLYWQALSSWEQATGREYEQALPGGESDARNTQAVREMILELFAVWDELAARHALPPELYIVELGVGNGSQARTWLDTFLELDHGHGRDYYRRLHYLMGDYSAHVLERARQAVDHHADRVNGLVLDATRPLLTLGFLRGKTFCVYISNVYDNLPTDELASIGGRPYLVEVRAYLPDEDATQITGRYRLADDALAGLTSRLLRLGPELLAEAAGDILGSTGQAVALWRDVWLALRLQERYVPLEGLDGYQLSPSVTGEILRPLMEGSGDIRMHASNGALASFEGTLALLHPFGRLLCHDLFLTGPAEYHAGFYGPGKYDGSVVNWVNGPLLQLVGSRRGYDVQIAPFRARPGSNVKTLTAQVRD
jgi:SAM-dependent methyltransferase